MPPLGNRISKFKLPRPSLPSLMSAWVKGEFGLCLASGTERPPLSVFGLVHEVLMMVFCRHLMLKFKVSVMLPSTHWCPHNGSNPEPLRSIGRFITSHTSSRGFRNSESPALHRCVFKRRGNFLRSVFLDPFSAPPSPDILRGAGKLSWASGLLRECPSQPTFAQVWRTRVLSHLSKTQGMSPTFFLFLPCSKSTSVPIWLGMSPP